MSGYIYIIKTRECIRMKENIYKIGRTEDILKRMKQYPKGSKLIYTVLTDNVVEMEGRLLFLLKDYVNHDLGSEYIDYNINLLKKIVDETVNVIDNTNIIVESTVNSENCKINRNNKRRNAKESVDIIKECHSETDTSNDITSVNNDIVENMNSRDIYVNV